MKKKLRILIQPEINSLVFQVVKSDMPRSRQKLVEYANCESGFAPLILSRQAHIELTGGD
ncbi:MAG TPA: hypothetical protein DCL44_10355 [Elusimicrobia bacterium]|nr:hypothetical protein [Elusimicrobiota bacterium]